MYDDLMSRLDASLAAIGTSVADLHGELEALEMPASVRDDAAHVWSRFFWTWKDVVDQQQALMGRLGAADVPSGDGETEDPDARVSIRWMNLWLRETLDSGQALVTRLDEASRNDRALAGVHAVLAEFHAEMTEAQRDVQQTLQKIEARLDETSR